MSSREFPGRGIPVDERIVAPESRAEIIGGQLHLSPPAHEKHAVPHADLAYVLRAHVRDEFLVAVDMLTRTSETNDFAPDASVYEAARDAETGGRRLEQLAFEVVSEQPLSVQTTKARELTRRGVRRMFCLVTKREKLLEWSRDTDGWSATPVEEIDDPCFIRALPVSALLKAAAADGAVIRALRAKGHPELERVREAGREEGREAGREEGREAGREEGREEALRIGILDLCESLGITLPEGAVARLGAMNAAALDAIRLAVKRDKRWPA